MHCATLSASAHNAKSNSNGHFMNHSFSYFPQLSLIKSLTCSGDDARLSCNESAQAITPSQKNINSSLVCCYSSRNPLLLLLLLPSHALVATDICTAPYFCSSSQDKPWARHKPPVIVLITCPSLMWKLLYKQNYYTFCIITLMATQVCPVLVLR